MISFACPTCGARYDVEDKHANKKTKCAKCKSLVVVPSVNVPIPKLTTSVVAPPAPSVSVSLQTTQPTGMQGFFRAFGITSGFMAAIAAVVLAIPILACGGCLVSMIGIGATLETPPNLPTTLESTKSSLNQSSEQPPAEILPDAPPFALEKANTPQIEKKIETIVVETLPTIDLSGRQDVYPIIDLTATIKDKFINDVRIIDLKQRPVTADVLFENNSGTNWTPRLEIEFVNAYGVLLGYDSISWLTAMEPKKRYTETVDFYPSTFDRTFRYSTIKRPPDYDMPKYLIINYR